jgi:hypothetical protein
MKYQQVLVGWANQESETRDGLVAMHCILQKNLLRSFTAPSANFPPAHHLGCSALKLSI